MDRNVYNTLIAQVLSESADVADVNKVPSDVLRLYGVRQKPGKLRVFELYRLDRNKVVIPNDQVMKTIHTCHRHQKKCLSVADTASNLSSEYEISQEQQNKILSLISTVIRNCPFCCRKQFVPEKPVLVRWSNGLLYKGYVLSREDRLCYVELDNYSTAVLNCKDVFDEFEHEVMCTVCLAGFSDPPNEIVLCDCCNVGYHQKCHKPVITDDVLKSDDEWFCSRCEASKRNSNVRNNVVASEPKYTLSTLACMALLHLGPSTRSAVHSWIQKHFEYYKQQKSDRWKARLATTMSITRHWLNLDKSSGLWLLSSYNIPSIIRHLSEVTKESKDDLPRILRSMIPDSPAAPPSLNLYCDVMPYDPSSLTWDPKHRYNEEGLYCYCMGDGVWYKQMLQCLSCLQWFHQGCVSCVGRPMLCGERNVFVCSVCNLGEEHLTTPSLSSRDALYLAMYHVVITRYHGDFKLPVCLRMNVLPLLREFDAKQFGGLQVWNLADIALENPDLFEVGAKHQNTTLYRLLVCEPPEYTVDRTLNPPLPPAPQTIPHFLPPGFVVELSNGTAGLQVDGSPPSEDYPPSQYDISIFKDLDYYGTKRKKKTASIKKKDKTKHDITGIAVTPKISAKSTKWGGVESEERAKRARTAEDDTSEKQSEEDSVSSSMTVRRLRSGEKYRILGRRHSSEGGTQYLIAWEGVKSRALPPLEV